MATRLSEPKDTKVTVLCLRENPEVSVLEPGTKGPAWFLLHPD